MSSTTYGPIQGKARDTERKEKPDYGRCVDIVTKGALREMVLPGLLAVFMPVAVGILFKLLGLGAEAVASFLMVGTIVGVLLATFLNNGGGAWTRKEIHRARPLRRQGKRCPQGRIVGDTSETHSRIRPTSCMC